MKGNDVDCKVDGDHDGSKVRSMTTSVMLSLISLKIGGAADAPKGRRARRYAKSSKTVMQVTAVDM